jgi:WD40 repeat protein
VETGRELHRREGEGNAAIAHHVAVSADGKFALLATGQLLDAPQLILWDIEQWQEVRRYEAQASVVQCLALSADGQLGLSGGREGEVILWDLSTGQQLRRYEPGVRGARSLAIDPEKRLAAFAGGEQVSQVKLFDLQTGEESRMIEGLRSRVSHLTFLPDGRRLLTGSSDGLRLWNVLTGEGIQYFSQEDVRAIAANNSVAIAGSRDGTVTFWDLETGRQRQRLEAHWRDACCVALSPDGKYAVSGGFDGAVRIWNIPEPEGDALR